MITKDLSRFEILTLVKKQANQEVESCENFRDKLTASSTIAKEVDF